MSAPKRKEIGKGRRFDVFRRDGFKCRYCGRTSEDTTLEVDHLEPKAKGGGNHMENLVTACIDCNRGKSAKEIAAPPTVDRLEMAQEIREQLELAKLIAKRDRAEARRRKKFAAQVEIIAHVPVGESFHGPTLKVFQAFARELGESTVLGWVAKAVDKVGHRPESIGRYVSGIRRKVKEEATR